MQIIKFLLIWRKFSSRFLIFVSLCQSVKRVIISTSDAANSNKEHRQNYPHLVIDRHFNKKLIYCSEFYFFHATPASPNRELPMRNISYVKISAYKSYLWDMNQVTMKCNTNEMSFMGSKPYLYNTAFCNNSLHTQHLSNWLISDDWEIATKDLDYFYTINKEKWWR